MESSPTREKRPLVFFHTFVINKWNIYNIVSAFSRRRKRHCFMIKPGKVDQAFPVLFFIDNHRFTLYPIRNGTSVLDDVQDKRQGFYPLDRPGEPNL